MDVSEDYLGSFPQTLKDKIRQSDVFVLVLPQASNYDYLCDPNNWVYKEIHYALIFKDAVNKPSRIVPITFDRDFSFPDKKKLGDIAEIADYSFIYYDTNNQESASKLIRAAGLKTRFITKIVMSVCTVVFSLILYLIIGIFYNPGGKSDKYVYAKTKDFVTSMNSLTTFNVFTNGSGQYVNEYLKWYLEELSNEVNPQMNTEFNEAYIKEYCIRLVVMTYQAFSSGDLDMSYDKAEIEKFVNLCYDNIPEEARYPISIKQKSNDARTQDFDTILDVTIETLNSDPRIRAIDDSLLPVLKSALKSKMWPL